MLGALTHFSGTTSFDLVFRSMIQVHGINVIGDDPDRFAYSIADDLLAAIYAQVPQLSNGSYYVYFEGVIEYHRTWNYNIREFEPDPTVTITHINFVYQKEPAYESA